jgi:DNA-binding NarL/FixJ family response regulator
MEDLSLAKIEAVRFALEQAVTVQEVKGIRDAADAMHRYSEQQRVGKDIQLKLAEYVVRAETKLGEILHAATVARQMGRGNKTGTNQYRSGNVPNENNSTFTLEQAGIDRKLSSRAQQLAAIPKEKFEEKLEELKEEGTITTNALLQMCRDAKKIDRAPSRHPRHEEVVTLKDNGLTNPEIAEELGMGKRQVRHIVDDEKIKREAVASIEPEITVDMISSMPQRERYERLVRQYEAQFAARVDAAARELAFKMRDDMVAGMLARLREEQKRLGWAVKSRHGIMNRKDYRKIWACLHTDRTDHFEMDSKMRAEYRDAWELFRSAEKLLLDERSSPTELIHIPTTVEEINEMRRQDAAARKAQKSSNTEMQAQ